MISARIGTALLLATILATATCEFGGQAPFPTEGEPPLAVIPPHPPRLSDGGGLRPLFAALADIEAGAAPRPVVAIQIGDSHSAADLFSGRMRELFQERFGAAGRGMMPAGLPYNYYRPRMARVAETGDWRRASSFTASGPFGIGGVIQQSADAGAQMTLTETEPAGFDRAFFEVLRQPGGGTLRMQVDDREPHEFATAAGAAGPHWVEFDAPRGSHRLTLGGAATVLAWGTQRQTSGIVYENFGVVGATVDVIGHWDPGTVAAELARRDPALIVVVFGTNEGVRPPQSLTRYAERFAARVKALRGAVPGAAVLVVGPPDVGRHGQPPVAGCDADWAPPPGIAIVREAQREVARREGWYFWDWQAAMGGLCAADRWARQDPPLELADHIHQKPDGYRRSAELLFAAIMDEYRQYRSATGLGS